MRIWDWEHAASPEATLIENDRVTRRIAIDGVDLSNRRRAQWHMRQAVERALDIHDRPQPASELVADALAAYKGGDAPKAFTLLTQAKVAYGGDDPAIRNRIEKGLALCQA